MKMKPTLLTLLTVSFAVMSGVAFVASSPVYAQSPREKDSVRLLYQNSGYYWQERYATDIAADSVPPRQIRLEEAHRLYLQLQRMKSAFVANYHAPWQPPHDTEMLFNHLRLPDTALWSLSADSIASLRAMDDLAISGLQTTMDSINAMLEHAYRTHDTATVNRLFEYPGFMESGINDAKIKYRDDYGVAWNDPKK